MSVTCHPTRSLLPFLVALSVLVCLGEAFVIPSTTDCPTQQRYNNKGVISAYNVSPREEFSVSLSAKKRRRRRKKDTESSPSPSPSPSSEQEEESFDLETTSPEPDVDEGTNELPDFDLDGTDAEDVVAKPRKEIDPEAITENMMGSGRFSARPLNELIQDRELESLFEFDEKADPSIPNFVDLAKASTTTPTYDSTSTSPETGKKKARQAERISKAVAAKEAEEKANSNFIKEYLPQFLDEKGKVSEVKILEQGAWVGIYALIGWEVYINSPFFDRAAPLAPVVFEILM